MACAHPRRGRRRTRRRSGRGAVEPVWRLFLRQFADLLIAILAVAAIVSAVVSKSLETPIVIGVVVLVEAATLAVGESTLTGEAAPVGKGTGAAPPDAALADRSDMVYMNTVVTRGRGLAVVTATGMGTEIDQIAELLEQTPVRRTPLQRQVDQLGRTIAAIAAAVVVVVVVLGVVQGRDLADLFLTGVSLAVAAIPEGLPAVVAFTLAMGTSRMAKRNEMTATAIWSGGRKLSVTGLGYGPDGRIHDGDGAPASLPPVAVEVLALCSDATVGDGQLVGDPTEGALVALAAKSGVDVGARRRRRPRLAEVPFDADYRLMATVHPFADIADIADGADAADGGRRAPAADGGAGLAIRCPGWRGWR
ncbi:cation-transporting P-type ATPase [Frankia tisae]|uniref:P-type ATPase n=1 Tax=Frankia tisae TaxID=2950104 RepID=UPI0021BE1D25|nr:cation-transporting P-type ATPase [Frankia tisae]